MKQIALLAILSVLFSQAAMSENASPKLGQASLAITWQSGADVDAFWRAYADSKGGLTWGVSSSYPEYAKVKEGDTLLIQIKQGSCLMEFFHSRWRRANDVRRWHDSINNYGGCPYVFD